MRSRTAALAYLALLLSLAACAESQPDEPIVGSWVIDAAAQREEIARVSPTELEDFEEAFRTDLLPVRETFHADGRYEVTHALGGPFQDRWELVAKEANTLTIRSSGHSWVARQANISAGTRRLSPCVLTYTFSDDDHMFVTTTMLIFGEAETISFFFVRDD
jgi:hypothetical protein